MVPPKVEDRHGRDDIVFKWSHDTRVVQTYLRRDAFGEENKAKEARKGSECTMIMSRGAAWLFNCFKQA